MVRDGKRARGFAAAPWFLVQALVGPDEILSAKGFGEACLHEALFA